ncbi:Alpha/Beta hydrolase protein [Crassisporium funariophilum]|nr:Alpha/Beta hydrolase protein [Crassisporium funariophilum]
MFLSAALVVLASYFYRETLFAAGASQADIIDTGYAKYLGNRSFPNTVAYLGIPYAEPPLGELRWRAPLPLNKARVARASGGAVVDATAYPNFCVQGTTGGGDAGGAGSEDCLKVNIYAPAGAKKGSNLPVLVYIHGGGYVFGNPANWPFDHWINQSPNVVIVSVYYRLSSFGFLATPVLSDSANGDLNAGFLDQVESLRWVKQNIASFGGNPDKVTINGESAGGSSVELHLVAKNIGQQLFHGAIAQSVYRSPLPTPAQLGPAFAFYANHAGCGTGTDIAKLACLRRASISALAMAQDATGSAAFTASGYKVFKPVIDNKILLDFPTRSIVSGNMANVPIIVGATTNETLAGGPTISAALKSYFPIISDADVNALIAAYPAANFASSDLLVQTLTGDASVRCARTIWARAFAKIQTSWTYRYNQKNPTSGGTAVAHASENWMMFKGTNTGFNGSTTFTQMTPTENAFAAELIAYWLSFVRAGNPNTFKLARSPTWSLYEGQNSRVVLQQGPGNSTTVSGSFVEQEAAEERTRCSLVASQVVQQQN